MPIEHDGHAEPERDREEDAVRGAAERYRHEQHDHRRGRRHQPAGQAEREQGTPAEATVGQLLRQVRVAEQAVAVVAASLVVVRLRGVRVVVRLVAVGVLVAVAVLVCVVGVVGMLMAIAVFVGMRVAVRDGAGIGVLVRVLVRVTVVVPVRVLVPRPVFVLGGVVMPMHDRPAPRPGAHHRDRRTGCSLTTRHAEPGEDEVQAEGDEDHARRHAEDQLQPIRRQE